MNWDTLFPLLITATLGVSGWWVAHYLSSNRDRTNKKRDLRVSYLIDAYRKLERASNATDPNARTDDVETAIADIQLFGSTRQVELAETFARTFAAQGDASLDDILQELRDDLRRELGIEAVGRGIVFLRIAKRGT